MGSHAHAHARGRLCAPPLPPYPPTPSKGPGRWGEEEDQAAATLIGCVWRGGAWVAKKRGCWLLGGWVGVGHCWDAKTGSEEDVVLIVCVCVLLVCTTRKTLTEKRCISLPEVGNMCCWPRQQKARKGLSLHTHTNFPLLPFDWSGQRRHPLTRTPPPFF